MPTAQHLTKLLSKKDLASVLDIINSGLSVGTEDQFRQLIQLTTQVIPVEKAHVSVADLDESSAIVNSSRQINIDFPVSWLKAYREQSLYRIDPIAKSLFSANEPLVWSRVRERFASKPAQTFYKRAADFGLREGFSFGARFSRSPSASFFTCVGKNLTSHRRHVLITQYLIPHLHAALSKVHLGLLKECPILTPREIEVLNWAKFGKTNWEISLQLNVSERAAKFHIENAIRKLHANNRSQAIAVALSQGLIEWG